MRRMLAGILALVLLLACGHGKPTSGTDVSPVVGTWTGSMYYRDPDDIGSGLYDMSERLEVSELTFRPDSTISIDARYTLTDHKPYKSSTMHEVLEGTWREYGTEEGVYFRCTASGRSKGYNFIVSRNVDVEVSYQMELYLAEDGDRLFGREWKRYSSRLFPADVIVLSRAATSL